MALDDVEKLIQKRKRKEVQERQCNVGFWRKLRKLAYSEMDEVAREWMLKEADADENVDLEGQHWDWEGREIATKVLDLKNRGGR